MKAGYLSFFAVALLVYVFTGRQKDDQPAADNSCVRVIEQYQEALFPRDRLMETEAWLLGISQMLNISAGSLAHDVANYEVGRATAMRLAISRANGLPECTVDQTDE
jgi:hypothetical protein